jgi:hypothetical protein
VGRASGGGGGAQGAGRRLKVGPHPILPAERGGEAAAYHADDLDGVALLKRGRGELGPLEDPSVHLHGDRPGVDAERAQVVEQRQRPGNLDLLAVHAQFHHASSRSNIEMAA